MRILSDILYKVKIKAVHGSTQVEVANLCQDSRLVAENSLFVAVKGFNVDGHAYIEKAIDLGAVAIVCQELPKEINDDVVYVQVADSAEALALIACNFYDNPSEKVKLVAITGTNGKTSVATLLWQLYKSLGYQVGLLSTVENKIGDKVIKATHTTPNAIALNELLAKMVDAGCEFVFIEASSHAIDQNRTYGLSFDGAVFTNLTHDHLDYHDTFLEYRNAKKRLFDLLPKTAFALTNADDKNGMVMLQNTKATQKSYALRTMSDFNAKVLENDFAGMIMNLDGAEFCSKLIGHFNAYNMLAVYATAILLGNEKMEVLTAMSALQGAEGRFDIVISPREKIVSIVDYAHTPDALKNVLQTINAVKHGDKKTITVVGC
ncbi:MAG: UDP-N-acetylmuramoyl-L-alanyl-D-glutamate--2,6-diaminopimelate ligase, partial [Chitinophagales bacterium]